MSAPRNAMETLVANRTTVLVAMSGDFANDAALARTWMPDSIVDAAVQRLAAGKLARLSLVLESEGRIDDDQRRKLDALPGVQVIGGFELQRGLGAGAMGEVWLARRLGDGRMAALKTILAERDASEDFLKRFEREADILAKLKHPNIAGSIGSGLHQGKPWLAMEYVAGPTVAELLERHGPLPEPDALRIIIQVARGLEHVFDHARLIHRDVKPGNILIDRSARPKDAPDDPLAPEDTARVIDFGLAKSVVHRSGAETMTMAGVVMGTPSYMSTEQIHGIKDLDGRTDQYALGATLFHLLTGRMPYTAPTPVGVLTAHINEPVPDPRATVPSIQPDTARLVATAMAKDRDQRFRSWSAFIKAADAALLACGGPTTVRFLRKPMVLAKPKAMPRHATPAGGTPVPDPQPARTSQRTPLPGSLMPSDAPAQRSGTGVVVRNQTTDPSRKGEAALAAAMNDRIQQISTTARIRNAKHLGGRRPATDVLPMAPASAALEPNQPEEALRIVPPASAPARTAASLDVPEVRTLDGSLWRHLLILGAIIAALLTGLYLR